MKSNGLIVLTVLMAIFLGSCGKSSIQSSKIKSDTDSLSYAFGIVNYNALIMDSLKLDPVLVAKAMLDGEKGKPVMTDEEARSFIMRFINQRLYKDYIEQNEAFLSKNKERQGVIITPSGLQYEVITMGTGPKPTANSTVKVHYVGTLIDGTEFDSSVKRNEPAQFLVSGVIPGWTEALQLMPVGSKFKIYLPQEIAYGPTGAGETIKPYSTLIFEVELLEIVQ
jgi:FKBP-type peptidyl-prolyl cis-trans isomerase